VDADLDGRGIDHDHLGTGVGGVELGERDRAIGQAPVDHLAGDQVVDPPARDRLQVRIGVDVGHRGRRGIPESHSARGLRAGAEEHPGRALEDGEADDDLGSAGAVDVGDVDPDVVVAGRDHHASGGVVAFPVERAVVPETERPGGAGVVGAAAADLGPAVTVEIAERELLVEIDVVVARPDRGAVVAADRADARLVRRGAAPGAEHDLGHAVASGIEIADQRRDAHAGALGSLDHHRCGPLALDLGREGAERLGLARAGRVAIADGIGAVANADVVHAHRVVLAGRHIGAGADVLDATIAKAPLAAIAAVGAADRGACVGGGPATVRRNAGVRPFLAHPVDAGLAGAAIGRAGARPRLAVAATAVASDQSEREQHQPASDHHTADGTLGFATMDPQERLERTQWDFFWLPDDAEVLDRPEVGAVRCARPASYLNSVVRTRCTADRAEAVVEEVVAFFGERASRWQVPDTFETAALERAMGRAGYRPAQRHEARCIRPEQYRARPHPALRVEPVRSLATLRDCIDVQERGFARPNPHTDDELEAELARCADPAGRIHRFVAYAGDEPVSSAGLTWFPDLRFGFLWAGATVPEARGQGAYSALVAARMKRARELGAEWVGLYALDSTSAPIVARQGFEDVGRMTYWVREGAG
jgi:hypothetical protein